MKIVLIHGQAHKGSTWHIADMLLQTLSAKSRSESSFYRVSSTIFALAVTPVLRI